MIQILKTKRIFVDLQRRIFQLDCWILPPLTHLGLLPPRKNYYLLTLLTKLSKNFEHLKNQWTFAESYLDVITILFIRNSYLSVKLI